MQPDVVVVSLNDIEDSTLTAPTTFVQGTTVTWNDKLEDYSPDDGWAAQYIFVSSSDQQAVAGVDDSNGGFDFALTAIESANWNAEKYDWQLQVSKSPDVFVPCLGQTVVTYDFTQFGTGLDTRSIIKKTLDALEQTILGKASKDQLSYTIKNRSLSRMSPSDLIEWYEKYKLWYRQELKAEKNAQGMDNTQTLKVRFRNP